MKTIPRLTRRIFSILLLSSLFLLSLFQPFVLVHGSVTWSSPILIDSHSGINQLSSSLQASNGTLWVAFQSNRNAESTGRFDVIYKTYTNGVWSTDHNLTMTNQNSGPSLVQLANGTIGVFWSLKQATSYRIFYAQYTPSGWSTPVQVTSTTLNDTQPSAAVGADGAIRLVWTRVDSTNPNVPAVKQLYYKTWANGVWSAEVQLTTDSNQNYGSSVAVSKDGIVRVTWSKGAAGGTYQLFEKTYDGTLWSPDTQIVSSSSTDEHPSMIQDRNGTLWIFWGRLIVVSSLVQYYIVFGKHSSDLAQTWSSEVQLTPTPGSTIFDSFQPSAVQSTSGVRPIWVFYTSNYNQPNYDIYAVQSSGIGPVHDVVVSGVSASNNLGTSWEYPGGFKAVGQSAIMTIAVAIKNTGDYVESVSAAVTATNTTNIRVGTVRSLVGPGNQMTFYYYWNTSSVKPARYGISVAINPLPGESLGNMGDNNYDQANVIHIIPLGDIDQDGSVTITDISIFTFGFNFSSTCGCSHWNVYADIANTGTIDIIDVTIASANFNTFA